MSYTATATRGIAPTSLNLNIFSHPPSKVVQPVPQQTRPEKKLQRRPSSVLTDDEDIFSLDMVTMDMDFDQAYQMYTLMQQKNALMGIEQLQQAQQINMNNTYAMQPQQPQQQSQQQSQQHLPPQHDHVQLQMGLSGSHTGTQTGHQTPTAMELSLLCAPGELMNGGGLFAGLGPETPQMEKPHDEMDQFFSNTESDALEKFLDRLASLSSLDPLQMYQNQHQQQQQPKMPLMFELHTMGSAEHKPVQRDIPDLIKKEITDAFKHPPVQSLKSFGTAPSQINTQLPTPLDSRQSLTSQHKRSYEDLLPPLSPLLKKKRKLTKPLLSLEQKRLNHSHSEQKRRLLCKEAYERCLRLITNVEDYKNDLVSASAVTSSKKKSKRKQINKEGLPNLSKHTALCKISEEIEKIHSKNLRLRSLLETSAGYR